MSVGSKAGKTGSELGLQLLKQAAAVSSPVSPPASTAASPASPPPASVDSKPTPTPTPTPTPMTPTPLSRREELLAKFAPVFLRHPALRNAVSGQGEKGLRAVCVPEMVGLIECLNGADYNQRRCTGHIATFQRCVEVEEAKRRRRKELIQNPGSGRSLGGRLAASQVNSLLAKFPTPSRALGEPAVNRQGRYVK